MGPSPASGAVEALFLENDASRAPLPGLLHSSGPLSAIPVALAKCGSRRLQSRWRRVPSASAALTSSRAFAVVPEPSCACAVSAPLRRCPRRSTHSPCCSARVVPTVPLFASSLRRQRRLREVPGHPVVPDCADGGGRKRLSAERPRRQNGRWTGWLGRAGRADGSGWGPRGLRWDGSRGQGGDRWAEEAPLGWRSRGEVARLAVGHPDRRERLRDQGARMPAGETRMAARGVEGAPGLPKVRAGEMPNEVPPAGSARHPRLNPTDKTGNLPISLTGPCAECESINTQRHW
jgi:hypothetical protein